MNKDNNKSNFEDEFIMSDTVVNGSNINNIMSEILRMIDIHLGQFIEPIKRGSNKNIATKQVQMLKNDIRHYLCRNRSKLEYSAKMISNPPYVVNEQQDMLQELNELRREIAVKTIKLAEAQRTISSLKTDERSRKAKLARLERQTNIKDLLDDCLLRFLSDIHDKAESATELETLKKDIIELEEYLFYDLNCSNIEILKFNSNTHLDNGDYKFVEVCGMVSVDDEGLDHCVQELTRYGAVIKDSIDDQTEIIKAKVILGVKK